MLKNRINAIKGISARTHKNQCAPHILVLQKTWGDWHNETKNWKRRCSGAALVFVDIGLEALKPLLADRYDELMEMRLIKRKNKNKTSPALPEHIIDLEC